jgi:hypothetical protein
MRDTRSNRNVLLIEKEYERIVGPLIMPTSFAVSSSKKLHEFLLQKYSSIQSIIVQGKTDRISGRRIEYLINDGRVPSYEVFRKKIIVEYNFRGVQASRFELLTPDGKIKDLIRIQKIPLYS